MTDFVTQSIQTTLSLGQVHYAVDILERANWLSPTARLPISTKTRLAALHQVLEALVTELKRNKDGDLLARCFKIVDALVELDRSESTSRALVDVLTLAVDVSSVDVIVKVVNLALRHDNYCPLTFCPAVRTAILYLNDQRKNDAKYLEHALRAMRLGIKCHIYPIQIMPSKSMGGLVTLWNCFNKEEIFLMLSTYLTDMEQMLKAQGQQGELQKGLVVSLEDKPGYEGLRAVFGDNSNNALQSKASLLNVLKNQFNPRLRWIEIGDNCIQITPQSLSYYFNLIPAPAAASDTMADDLLHYAERDREGIARDDYGTHRSNEELGEFYRGRGSDLNYGLRRNSISPTQERREHYNLKHTDYNLEHGGRYETRSSKGEADLRNDWLKKTDEFVHRDKAFRRGSSYGREYDDRYMQQRSHSRSHSRGRDFSTYRRPSYERVLTDDKDRAQILGVTDVRTREGGREGNWREYREKSRNEDRYEGYRPDYGTRDYESGRYYPRHRSRGHDRDNNSRSGRSRSRSRGSSGERTRDRNSDRLRNTSGDRTTDRSRNRLRDVSRNRARGRSRDRLRKVSGDKIRDRSRDQLQNVSEDRSRGRSRDWFREVSGDRARSRSHDRSLSASRRGRTRDDTRQHSSSPGRKLEPSGERTSRGAQLSLRESGRAIACESDKNDRQARSRHRSPAREENKDSVRDNRHSHSSARGSVTQTHPIMISSRMLAEQYERPRGEPFSVIDNQPSSDLTLNDNKSMENTLQAALPQGSGSFVSKVIEGLQQNPQGMQNSPTHPAGIANGPRQHATPHANLGLQMPIRQTFSFPQTISSMVQEPSQGVRYANASTIVNPSSLGIRIGNNPDMFKQPPPGLSSASLQSLVQQPPPGIRSGNSLSVVQQPQSGTHTANLQLNSMTNSPRVPLHGILKNASPLRPDVLQQQPMPAMLQSVVPQNLPMRPQQSMPAMMQSMPPPQNSSLPQQQSVHAVFQPLPAQNSLLRPQQPIPAMMQSMPPLQQPLRSVLQPLQQQPIQSVFPHNLPMQQQQRPLNQMHTEVPMINQSNLGLVTVVNQGLGGIQRTIVNPANMGLRSFSMNQSNAGLQQTVVNQSSFESQQQVINPQNLGVPRQQGNVSGINNSMNQNALGVPHNVVNQGILPYNRLDIVSNSQQLITRMNPYRQKFIDDQVLNQQFNVQQDANVHALLQQSVDIQQIHQHNSENPVLSSASDKPNSGLFQTNADRSVLANPSEGHIVMSVDRHGHRLATTVKRQEPKREEVHGGWTQLNELDQPGQLQQSPGVAFPKRYGQDKQKMLQHPLLGFQDDYGRDNDHFDSNPHHGQNRGVAARHSDPDERFGQRQQRGTLNRQEQHRPNSSEDRQHVESYDADLRYKDQAASDVHSDIKLVSTSGIVNVPDIQVQVPVKRHMKEQVALNTKVGRHDSAEVFHIGNNRKEARGQEMYATAAEQQSHNNFVQPKLLGQAFESLSGKNSGYEYSGLKRTNDVGQPVNADQQLVITLSKGSTAHRRVNIDFENDPAPSLDDQSVLFVERSEQANKPGPKVVCVIPTDEDFLKNGGREAQHIPSHAHSMTYLGDEDLRIAADVDYRAKHEEHDLRLSKQQNQSSYSRYTQDTRVTIYGNDAHNQENEKRSLSQERFDERGFGNRSSSRERWYNRRSGNDEDYRAQPDTYSSRSQSRHTDDGYAHDQWYRKEGEKTNNEPMPEARGGGDGGRRQSADDGRHNRDGDRGDRHHSVVRKVVMDRLYEHVNAGRLSSAGVSLLAGKLTGEFIKSRTIAIEFGALRSDIHERLMDFVDGRIGRK